MSQLQDLTRCLLAAGYAARPDRQYLLYTQDGVLISKLWTGDSFGEEELVATSVRPDSSAAILADADDRVIIGITASSTLAAFQYDEDEEEWIQDGALSAYNVHEKGRLSACYTADHRICIVFQNGSGALVHIEETEVDSEGSLDEGTGWTATVLKKASDPLPGTPISTVLDDNGLHVFYVSAADQRVHHLHGGETWADEEMFDQTLGPVVTADKAVLQVEDGGDKRELGKVDDNGKLVPSTTAECFFFFYYFFYAF
ncbi:uncharacterized protein C8Q71DRAFT_792452 [Rhodofomes roseus]|uniref:Fucose-specific lectin n=1 Tax=Rhodofomes roseus TaxID=34475 RepID=A0ABQ8JXF7_9APHY|nr:uncharacterized protein C8Q71DRAFT_792452 [Rhodofomes roseus]KAH9828785.1 hypothetical protein C8Q71DRAFT_792452 [Rhodofomes roseus]